MIGILLMSGKGERFAKAGFELPKPLIPINGQPMFVRSLNSFPIFSKLYLVTTERISSNPIFKKSLEKIKYDYEVISLKKTTGGQAESCYLAVENIENDRPFFVGPCDFEFENKPNLKSIFLNNEDIIIVSYKPNKVNFAYPNQYGWIEVDSQSLINEIHIKSNRGINKDQAMIISGTFLFKNKQVFLKYYEIMKSKNIKVNNEYYIDTLCKVALEEGSKVLSLNVLQGSSFGSPQEILGL